MAYLWLLLYADFIRIDIEFDTLSIAIEYEMNWNRFECYPYLRNVITHWTYTELAEAPRLCVLVENECSLIIESNRIKYNQFANDAIKKTAEKAIRALYWHWLCGVEICVEQYRLPHEGEVRCRFVNYLN